MAQDNPTPRFVPAPAAREWRTCLHHPCCGGVVAAPGVRCPGCQRKWDELRERLRKGARGEPKHGRRVRYHGP